MDSIRGDDKLITELNISNTEDEEVQPFHYFLEVAFASYVITFMQNQQKVIGKIISSIP